MADGLSYGLGKIGSESIADSGVDAADLASSSVTTAKIAAAAVTAAKQGFVGIGSPTGFGNSIQMGEIVASAGSVAEIAFPTAFAAAPTVIATFVGGTAAHPSVSAGSAIINTTSASASGVWIAIGSGNL